MAEAISVKNEEQRLETIAAQIVNYANGNFDEQLEISEERDNIDSIVVGLNLLGEELKSQINQLSKREKQLEEAIFRLNEAQHLAMIGSWEWDIVKNKIEWTQELYNLYGVDSETFEANYENYLSFIYPEDREFVNSMVQKAYADKQPFNFFHRFINQKGELRILHSRGEVFVNNKGEPIKMTGTAQDVTDVKKAEQENATLSAIVESSGDAIISKDLQGKITSWNPKAELLFGYKKEEILGKSVTLLFPEDRLLEEDLIMNNIQKNHPLENFETERKRKNGSVFPVSITISPIRDAFGNVTGVSTIARDITQKKIAEEKINRYTKELEYKNRETQQFAFIASHDLQEPLRTITNYINLFYDDYKGKLDENADTYLRFIKNSASRMQTLIHDLLEYTRLENDNTIIDIDLNTVVEEVVASMKNTIEKNQAQIHIGKLPVIKGVRVRIHSLFQNLISNSLKYRKPELAPVISIKSVSRGPMWQFEITDNGIGIEKNYYEKIFKLFQRLHGRHEYEGTGIGLAHCKKIVELAGGKIWVESQVNEGSSFYFQLPKTIIE